MQGWRRNTWNWRRVWLLSSGTLAFRRATGANGTSLLLMTRWSNTSFRPVDHFDPFRNNMCKGDFWGAVCSALQKEKNQTYYTLAGTCLIYMLFLHNIYIYIFCIASKLVLLALKSLRRGLETEQQREQEQERQQEVLQTCLLFVYFFF